MGHLAVLSSPKEKPMQFQKQAPNAHCGIALMYTPDEYPAASP
jgi:hypothetical protein